MTAPTLVLTPAQVLVRAVKLLDFVREVPSGANDGPFIRDALADVGHQPGAPWCAAGLTRIAVRMFGRAWPVPRTAGCDVILEWAIKHGVLLLPQRTQALWAQRYPTRASHWRQMDGAPMHGDLFLTMAHPGDATHVGVVDEARDDESFSTGECNANAAGSREGNAITTLPRRNHATDTRVYALVRWQGMIR